MTLVLVRRFEVARYTSALAVGAITVGWVFAQQPYLRPGRLTLEEAAAAEEALSALLVSVGVGLLLLVAVPRPIADSGSMRGHVPGLA